MRRENSSFVGQFGKLEEALCQRLGIAARHVGVSHCILIDDVAGKKCPRPLLVKANASRRVAGGGHNQKTQAVNFEKIAVVEVFVGSAWLNRGNLLVRMLDPDAWVG